MSNTNAAPYTTVLGFKVHWRSRDHELSMHAACMCAAITRASMVADKGQPTSANWLGRSAGMIWPRGHGRSTQPIGRRWLTLLGHRMHLYCTPRRAETPSDTEGSL